METTYKPNKQSQGLNPMQWKCSNVADTQKAVYIQGILILERKLGTCSRYSPNEFKCPLKACPLSSFFLILYGIADVP